MSSVPGPIRALSQSTVNKIRDGMALNSVAQVVEELVYNSLDAEATTIKIVVEIINHNISIKVTDNGVGIPMVSLHVVGDRYWTTKTNANSGGAKGSTGESTETVAVTGVASSEVRGNNAGATRPGNADRTEFYYGQKGETLACLRGNSNRLNITSRHRAAALGYSVELCKNRRGQVMPALAVGSSPGTRLEVHGLFSRQSVKRSTSASRVTATFHSVKQAVIPLILLHPRVDIHLSLGSGGRNTTTSFSVGTGSFSAVFRCLFGSIATLPVSLSCSNTGTVTGCLGLEPYPSTEVQILCVNKHRVQDVQIQEVVANIVKSSKSFITAKPSKVYARHPAYALFLQLPTEIFCFQYESNVPNILLNKKKFFISMIEQSLKELLRREGQLPVDPNLGLESLLLSGIKPHNVSSDSREDQGSSPLQLTLAPNHHAKKQLPVYSPKIEGARTSLPVFRDSPCTNNQVAPHENAINFSNNSMPKNSTEEVVENWPVDPVSCDGEIISRGNTTQPTLSHPNSLRSQVQVSRNMLLAAGIVRENLGKEVTTSDGMEMFFISQSRDQKSFINPFLGNRNSDVTITRVSCKDKVVQVAEDSACQLPVDATNHSDLVDAKFGKPGAKKNLLASFSRCAGKSAAVGVGVQHARAKKCKTTRGSNHPDIEVVLSTREPGTDVLYSKATPRKLNLSKRCLNSRKEAKSKSCLYSNSNGGCLNPHSKGLNPNWKNGSNKTGVSVLDGSGKYLTVTPEPVPQPTNFEQTMNDLITKRGDNAKYLRAIHELYECCEQYENRPWSVQDNIMALMHQNYAPKCCSTPEEEKVCPFSPVPVCQTSVTFTKGFLSDLKKFTSQREEESITGSPGPANSSPLVYLSDSSNAAEITVEDDPEVEDNSVGMKSSPLSLFNQSENIRLCNDKAELGDVSGCRKRKLIDDISGNNINISTNAKTMKDSPDRQSVARSLFPGIHDSSPVTDHHYSNTSGHNIEIPGFAPLCADSNVYIGRSGGEIVKNSNSTDGKLGFICGSMAGGSSEIGSKAPEFYSEQSESKNFTNEESRPDFQMPKSGREQDMELCGPYVYTEFSEVVESENVIDHGLKVYACEGDVENGPNSSDPNTKKAENERENGMSESVQSRESSGDTEKVGCQNWAPPSSMLDPLEEPNLGPMNHELDSTDISERDMQSKTGSLTESLTPRMGGLIERGEYTNRPDSSAEKMFNGNELPKDIIALCEEIENENFPAESYCENSPVKLVVKENPNLDVGWNATKGNSSTPSTNRLKPFRNFIDSTNKIVCNFDISTPVIVDVAVRQTENLKHSRFPYVVEKCEHTKKYTVNSKQASARRHNSKLNSMIPVKQIRDRLGESNLLVENFSVAEQFLALSRKSFGLSDVAFDREIIADLTVIGQVDDKYIATLATSGHILLWDQHAVHERIRLELFIRLTTVGVGEEFSVRRCELSPPLLIDLKIIDQDTLARNLKTLERFGVCIFILAGSSGMVECRSVPACFTHHNSEKQKLLAKSLVVEMLEYCEKGTVPPRLPQTIHNCLASKACRGAVMFGQTLELSFMQHLLKDLTICQAPFQCAHGRPSIFPLLNLEDL